MLARIDGVPGVRESRVDWTGKHVLLVLQPGADEEAVTRAALEAIGNGARHDPHSEADRIAEFRRGEPWLRAGETLRLSEEEARVVGERLANKAAGEVGLDPDQTRWLTEIVQDELRLAFADLHAGAGDQPDRRAASLQRLRERAGAFLTNDQAGRVCEALARAFRGG